jgi:hypothetical protein
MPAPQQITIHVNPPLITPTPKGGHVHVGRQAQMQWVSNDAAFTLSFEDLDTGGTEWPFIDPQPQWPVTETKVLTFKEFNITRYLKYVVTVKGCPALDPIIIIER